MIISSVNANDGQRLVQNNDSSKSGFAELTQGTIVEGVISKVSDMISITFNDQEVQVPRSAVQDAKEGEVRKFEIKEISKKSIVLKEVGTNEKTTSSKIVSTKVDMDQATFIASLKDMSTNQIKHESEQNLNDQLLYIAGTMTSGDYEELEKEPSALEEYNMERLERALNRIKHQRQFRERHIEKQVEQSDEKERQIRDVSEGDFNSKIVDRLQQYGLPVSEQSVQRISLALNLTSSVTNLSDYAMRDMIDKGLEPTIENIYKSSYTGQGSYHNSSVMDDSTWNSLQDQVEKILVQSGHEVSDESMKQAKWLFQNGLPINETTLEEYQQLQQIKDNTEPDCVLDLVVQSILDGIQPEKTNLSDPTYDEAIQLYEDVQNIEDSTVYAVAGESDEITLGQLIKAQKDKSTIVMNATTIQSVTALRQLEEIRLKLSVENAHILLKQGLKMDTALLENVVDQLKRIEDNYYAGLLTEQEVIASEENIGILSQTTEKIDQLKLYPCDVIGATIHNSRIQNIQSLYQIGIDTKMAYENANERYESLMTQPNAELGDSITKAFRNIEDILKDCGLDNTSDNRRAVRILGYNSMEINRDSIIAIRSYDSKVNDLLNRLNPTTTVALIKHNVNPLTMSIDELSQKISELSEDTSLVQEESFSKYLYQLDKKQGLSKEERSSYIGIYRLLHQIDHSDGAAVGAVIQSNKPLTLNNLLTAVRTQKSSGIDETIEYQNNETVHSGGYTNNIVNQIQTAFSSNQKNSSQQGMVTYEALRNYATHVIGELKNKITPDFVEMINNEQQIGNIAIDQLENRLNEVREETLDYEADMVEKIRSLAAYDTMKSIQLLQKNQIDVTISNLFAANYLLDPSVELYDEVKKMLYGDEKINSTLDSIVDAIGDETSLNKAFSQMEQQIQNMLDYKAEGDEMTYEDLSKLRQIGKSISLVSRLSNNRQYEIPIMTGDSISTMRLTIVQNTNESGNVKIQMETHNFGFIYVDMSIQEGKLSGIIVCDSKDSLEQLQAQETTLSETLEKQGVHVKSLKFTLNRYQQLASHMNDTVAESTSSTKTLYQVAKSCVEVIRNIEQRTLEKEG